MKTFYFKAIVLIVIIFCATCAYAQKYNIDWVKGIGRIHNEGISSFAVDKAGNIYSVGYFSDTLDFDSGPGTLKLYPFIGPPNIDHDATFIYKTDAQGNPVWIKKFEGLSALGISGSRIRPSITMDSEQHIFIAGSFMGTVDFDPGPLTHNVTAQSAANDMFIVKLDTAGSLGWVKTISAGVTGGAVQNIKNDAAGNLYLAGSIGMDVDSIDFDPGAGVAKQPTDSWGHIFILKLTNAGNYVWATTIREVQDIYNMTVDMDGNVLLTGLYYSTVDFDPGAGTSMLTPIANSQDIFIAKFNSAGNHMWARGIGTSATDAGTGITTDISGNVYTTGFYGFNFFGTLNEMADFDPGAGTYNFPTDGTSDAFISKLSPAGDFVWARRIGGISMDAGIGITVKDGRVYTMLGVVGIDSFSNANVDFDPGAGVFNVGFSGIGDARMGMSVLDTGGNFVWGGIMGPRGVIAAADYIRSNIVIDNNGSIYLAGEYVLSLNTPAGPSDFDPGPANVMVNYGGDDGNTPAGDIFLMKFNRCEEIKNVAAQSCDAYVFKGHTYTNSGIFTHTISNNPGICDTAYKLSLTIHRADTTITRSGVTLTSNATGVAYQWVDCDNGYTPVNGAMNASFTPTVDGSYAVVLAAGGGCFDTSYCYTVTGTGIAGIGNANRVYIYPNPAQTQINIELSKALDNGSVKLINVLRQTVWQHKQVSGHHLQIDVSSFAAGVYVLELAEGDKIFKTKVIKQ